MTGNIKKKILVLLSLIVPCFIVSGQEVWQRMYGENFLGKAIQQTPDGGYISCGDGINTTTNQGYFYLQKVDSTGNQEWNKTYSVYNRDYAGTLCQVSSGGYIMAGTARNDTGNVRKVCIIKTDSAGDTLWVKVYSSVNELEDSYSIFQTTNNCFVISGASLSFTTNYDQLLFKIDSMGNVLWSKSYGGTDDEYGVCVEETNDRGYILTGPVHSFGFWLSGILLTKLDSIGNILWCKIIGDNSASTGSTQVHQTHDGGFIVSGGTTQGAGDYDGLLIKFDSSGNIVWSKSYGNTFADHAEAVIQTTDYGFVFAGFSSSFSIDSTQDVIIVKTDSSGALLWSKIYGSNNYDYINDMSKTSDAGFILTGMSQSLGSALNLSYVLKLDSSGYGGCNELIPFIIVSQLSLPDSAVALTTNNPTINTEIPYVVLGSQNAQEILCSSTNAIELFPQIYLTLSPNPSQGLITIKFSGDVADVQVEIYDMLGLKRALHSVTQGNRDINLIALTKGIYLLNFKSSKFNIFKKVILQ